MSKRNLYPETKELINVIGGPVPDGWQPTNYLELLLTQREVDETLLELGRRCTAENIKEFGERLLTIKAMATLGGKLPDGCHIYRIVPQYEAVAPLLPRLRFEYRSDALPAVEPQP